MAMASGNEDVPSGVDLQQLIKDRKATAQQKARNRQLQDFKSIALLNWKNLDGRHPLQILPAEVWRLILSNLTDPWDLQNASHCCPLFAELLEPRRLSDILFPMILGVDRFREKVKIDRWDNGLVPLRRVCKSLRRQVDKWWEASNRTKVLKYPMRDPDYDYLTHILTNFDPDCATRAIKLSHTSWDLNLDQPRDDVDGEPAEKFADFCKLLKKSLKLVGEQIQKFTFQVDKLAGFVEAGVTVSDLYELLLTLVNLMPNLKSLFLESQISDDDGFEPEPEPRLKELIGLKPFPKLENLVDLGFMCGLVVPETDVFESVVRSNPQITEMYLADGGDDITGDVLEAIKSLPLETVTFETVVKYGGSTGLDVWSKFVSPRPNWPLKKISLVLAGDRLDVLQLFQLLEEFPDVETLRLDINQMLISNSDGLRPLRLPKLKVFCFECRFIGEIARTHAVPFAEKSIFNGFTLSLDYLLLAKQLEEVNWACFVDGGEKRLYVVPWHEMIQFNGGSADLCNSNVWQVFPTLKKIEVQENNRQAKKAVYYRGQKIATQENSTLSLSVYRLSY